MERQEEPKIRVTKWEKPVWEVCTSCGFVHMVHREIKTMESWKDPWGSRVSERERCASGAQGAFRAMKPLSACDTVMGVHVLMHLSKPTEGNTPCNKVTLGDGGESMWADWWWQVCRLVGTLWGRWCRVISVIWEISMFSPQFCWGPKTALKNNVWFL